MRMGGACMPWILMQASYLPHRSALHLWLLPGARRQIEPMCILLSHVSAGVLPVPKQIWSSDHSPLSPFPEKKMYFFFFKKKLLFLYHLSWLPGIIHQGIHWTDSWDFGWELVYVRYVLSMRTPAWKAHRGSEAQWHGEMFFETGLTQSQQRSLCLSLPRTWIASLYHHTWLVA